MTKKIKPDGKTVLILAIIGGILIARSKGNHTTRTPNASAFQAGRYGHGEIIQNRTDRYS